MANELTKSDAANAAQDAIAVAHAYAAKAFSPATLRAYRTDWKHYDEWCVRHGFLSAPADPEAIGAYLASLTKTHAPTTIKRRLDAIRKIHRFNDFPWNGEHRAIRGTMQGIMREHARPPKKSAALTLVLLRRLLTTCDDTARGRRDRAVLLFGFAGALRVSELAGLLVEDVSYTPGGLRLRIRRSKTDQEGKGEEIGLPRGTRLETCPVRAFESWQEIAERKTGPLFRRIFLGGKTIGGSALHKDSVAYIFEERCRLAGIDSGEFGHLSSHAMRVGFITEAYDRGVRDEDIMRHTRHKHHQTMRGYVRRPDAVVNSPAKALGL